MNKKKHNARHLDTSFHFNYLIFLPLTAFVAIILFMISVQKATEDQRDYGKWLRDIRNEKIRAGITYYKVGPYDTLDSIAEQFEVSKDTIMWANDIPEGGISENMVLLISPVTGVVHIVETGDTIASIAKRYGVTTKKITNYPFNDFTNDTAFPISPGQILIVPGGSKVPWRDNLEYYRNIISL